MSGRAAWVRRPANYAPGGARLRFLRRRTPHRSTSYAVVDLQGKVFMNTPEDPFRTIDAPCLKQITAKVILVDFHGEATSEKVAMGWYLDGRVTAVLGTHTHVPTADERVLPGGTAYQTDVGMSGPYDSVIGVEKELVLARFLTGMPGKFGSRPQRRPYVRQAADRVRRRDGTRKIDSAIHARRIVRRSLRFGLQP